MTASELDAGTYEVLRLRLSEQAAELARRADTLNAQRLEVFGSAQLKLLGTERIRTEHNCVPRDIVSVAGLMLFGFNVFIGLKPETTVEDVFSLHRFSHNAGGFRFDDAGPSELRELLHDQQFRRDFGELYRYYRQTRLLQLRRVDDRLLAVFQTGPRTEDIRVLRWHVVGDGTVRYLDNRGERDHVFGPSHDFEWTRTTRENHVLGRHPHISIEDEVFVETVGGDLTVKVENNTETGVGVYSEPVDEPLQSLADAEVHYARVGPLILLRILPYKETAWRHLVFNTRTRDAVRLDGIGQACQRLPEDHGIIFPGGYYLDTGVTKTFDTDVDNLEFERVLRSPNGEDVLYVFHARAEGRTLLLPYNVIRKEVAAPLPCHGYSLFNDGTMVAFRALSEEPSRVHSMQVWQTPFQSEIYSSSQPAGTGPLERVGNADLVRGISDCLSITRMVDEMAPSAQVFEALIAACTRAFDHYHWLGEQPLGDLRTPLTDVRTTAEQVLDEFEAVTALTAQAAEAVDGAAERIGSLVRQVHGEVPSGADAWVRRLAEMHRAQGQLVTLRELRYADLERIEALSRELDTALAEAAQRAVRFLQQDDAFGGYHAEVDRLVADASDIATVAEAEPIAERLRDQASELDVLTDVIGGLDIADAVVRTRVLEHIGEVIGSLNRARATLTARRGELLEVEGRAEFAAEFALLAQAITGGLAVADTPQRCEEQLGKLLLQLENLESHFGEFDEFLGSLAEKRTAVYEAFSSRKQALLDERARRADRLVDSAERILASVRRRAGSFGSVEEINTYFAADPMVAKLRGVTEELRSLGDQVRAEELSGRVQAARQEAGRALRDRIDLYGSDGETIRLGRNTFAVNTQEIDLTLVPHDGAMAFAITATDYRAPVRDEDFEATRPFWDQMLVSESPQVYRAEYLATSILAEMPPEELRKAESRDGGLLDLVRRVAGERYDEGYARGVHDHDASTILRALLSLYSGAGLLRYPPGIRAAAQLFWAFGTDGPARSAWTVRAASLVRAREAFGRVPVIHELASELSAAMAAFFAKTGLFAEVDLAGEYLVEELAAKPAGFVTSAGARDLLGKFRIGRRTFSDDLRALDSVAERHQLAHAWLKSFVDSESLADDELAEAVAIELCGRELPRYDSTAELSTTVNDLLGSHPRIVNRSMTLRLDEVIMRTYRFRVERVPGFRSYQRQRNALVTRERERLRLPEYLPKVMSGFVRNRLLDEVYLPLIGDNLAKQLGAAGEGKRTDQSGLLLLISPPGYGKTTLLEYVASRLGLVFVKVNGPALGHDVTSVDPYDAPNATARQEVEKISFALEQGNNALLYLDDIQHTSPELLQKFISLCDAQRRMEGVWEGRTRTYDLRGKRFAVCMAGNPYTEAGRRFRIPDMLANRADVWNLGDVLSGKEDIFALSYIENALTSNPVLAPLVSRERSDVDVLVRLAKGDGGVRPEQLTYPYSAPELDQILSVLRKLLRVAQVVLANNRAYIASAAQSDSARTEPPFLLQGSYRNMNKLAERIVPAMNGDELEALIDDHYSGEAQTLTSGAEANLLKLAELRGRLTADQAHRWAEVKAAYLRSQALGGADDDPMSRAVGAMGLLADRVGHIETAIERAANRITR